MVHHLFFILFLGAGCAHARFHGRGRLHFPGKGTYVGEWENGNVVSGTYVFSDELEFAEKDWQYLNESDRRFYSEIREGIAGGACVQLTNHGSVPDIPLGCYDVGDGYLNPAERQVYSYNGDVLRTATDAEERWAIASCRVHEEEQYLEIGVVRPPRQSRA